MNQATIVTSALFLGAGLAGALESILVRYQLQAQSVGPSDANLHALRWNGLMFAFAGILVVAGLVRLWRVARRMDVPRCTQTFVGALCVGFGLFQFIEGLAMHHVLGIHHIHAGSSQMLWDLTYLASGVMMIVGGWAAVRMARDQLMPRDSMRPTFI